MEAQQSTNLHSFIRSLVSAVANAALYSLDHQQVTRLTEAAHSSLVRYLASDEELALLLVDDQLVCCGSPLEGSLYFGRMVYFLRSHGVGHATFVRGVELHELLALIASLAKPLPEGQKLQPSPHIRLGQVDVQLGLGGTEEGQEELRRRIPDLADIPGEELALFLEMHEGVKKHKRLNVTGISEVVSGFVTSFHEVSGPLMALAPLRALDEYTFTHSTTVCVLNLAQAMSLGIEGQLLHDIGVGAMLHDIGKLYIPEEVLRKPGNLSDWEWQLIHQHPVKGAQYLLDTPGVPRLAVVAAFEHHMKYNQSGYPRVPDGWVQSLCGYMTTISDVFDALRTRRAYRGAVDFERVATIMGELSGTDLHPFLTQNFLKLLAAMGKSGTAA
jgi:HD-GYP domain-containing protein (c-di-GMP phosphodiesterase class II)